MRGAITAMLAVAWLAVRAEPAGPPPNDRWVLDTLLAEYRAHKLPLPPKGAKLVRYFHAHGDNIDGEQRPDVYALGHLVRSDKGEERLLRGLKWTRATAASPKRGPAAPEPSALKTAADGPREPLAFAVQCHSLGWTHLAVATLSRVRGDRGGADLDAIRSLAWEYWCWMISEEGSDWKEVTRRLKAISTAGPDFRSGYHRRMIEDLELALTPRKVKPGSIDELIEKLAGQPGRAGTGIPTDPPDGQDVLDFAAVPVLIGRLDDRRMTRYTVPRFNNFGGWHKRVQHVVSDLLEMIAAKPLGRDGWILGHSVKKADAEAWWKEAKKLGEEKYALANVLPASEDSPDEYLLDLIARKYPRHLAPLYRSVLRGRAGTDSSGLLAAVMGSTLPLKQKHVLLHEGALRPSLSHRREALSHLLGVDRTLSLQIIRHTLLRLPTEAKGNVRGWEVAQWAGLVSRANDPGLWEVLGRVAKRADIALRMVYLNNLLLDADEWPASWKRNCIAFLSPFLDDSGPVAGFHYDVLSVRDFAAMLLAHLLDIAVPPKRKHSEKEWAELRQQVRAALRR